MNVMVTCKFRGQIHDSFVHWYHLYLLVTGLLAGDPLSGDHDVMMWAISPRGVSPWSPDIKQLKLTR